MRLTALSLAIALSSTGALGADVPTFEDAPAPLFEPAPIAFNWSGFSIGANAGWAWANVGVSQLFNDTENVKLNSPSDDFDFDDEGFIGGVQVGYDRQWRSLVLGVGAEVGVLDLRKTVEDSTVLPTPVPGSDPDTEFGSDIYGAITGRLGVAVDRVLVYGRAGVGFLNADGSTEDDCRRGFCGLITIDASGDDALFGWTAGAGVEVALTDHWSLGGEYRYFDFEDLEVSGEGSNGLDYSQDLDMDAHTLRGFVNYRW